MILVIKKKRNTMGAELSGICGLQAVDGRGVKLKTL